MPVPGHSDLIGLLQDETGDTGLFETSSHGEPGWSRANDDRRVCGILKSCHGGMIGHADRGT